MSFRSPTRVFLTCLVFSAALPSVALASDSAALLQDYFDGFRKLGATRVEHGPIEDDPASGTATVSDISITLPITVSFGKAGSFTLQFGFEQPDFTITNAERIDGGYRVEAATAEGATAVSLSIDGVNDFKMDASVEEWRGEGLYWPDIPSIGADPDRPLTRYYPLFRWVAAMEANRVSVRRVEVDQTGPQGTKQHTVYNDLVTSDQHNGVIGVMQVGRTVVESSQPMPAPQSQAGETPGQPGQAEGQVGKQAKAPEVFTLTYEVGSIRYRNYDIGRLVNLFDPEAYAAGQSDDMYYSVLEEAWANDISVNAEGAQIRIGRYGGTGFGMRRPELNFLAFMDRLAKGEEPDPKEALRYGLAMLGSFAMERLSIDDVAVTPPPGEEGGGRLERFIMRNLSADRLGEIAIEGLDVTGPDDVAVKLERFGIKDVIFPTADAIMALADYTEQNPGKDPPPSLVLPVIPLLYEIETRGFAVSKADIGTISLDNAVTRFANHIGAIPTMIMGKVENFQAPVAVIDDPEAKVIFQRMGLDQIVFNEEISIRWDEETQDLIIDPVVLDLEGAGRISFSARFAGVPRLVFENPQAAQQALATLAFTSAKLQIDNDSLVQAALALAAEDKNVSVEDARNEILMQIRQGAQQLQDPALAKMVDDAVSAFLANPDVLTVEAKPNTPMPLTQIMGMAAVAPQAIVQQLGLVIRAAP